MSGLSLMSCSKKSQPVKTKSSGQPTPAPAPANPVPVAVTPTTETIPNKGGEVNTDIRNKELPKASL